MTRIAVLVVGLLVVALAAPAHAISISQGQDISLTFPAPAGNSHLAADATITLSTLTSSDAVLDIVVNNTSSGDTGFTDRLVSLGFLMSPAPTASSALSVTFGSGTDKFQKGSTPDGVPSFSGSENVCLYVGNNCSAGNKGLTAGKSDEFTVSLPGIYGKAIDLSNFSVKWTDCTGCSFEIAGVPTTPTPEPTSLALLGSALVALGAWARKSGRRLIRA